jgi:hypothetical protein
VKTVDASRSRSAAKTPPRGVVSYLGRAHRKRRSVMAAALALPMIVLVAPSANAAATVTRFADTYYEIFADTPSECVTPSEPGITYATEAVTGSFVDTGRTRQVVYENVFSYRTDFPDGSYLEGVSTAHGTFITTQTTFVHTDGGVEPRTVYSSAGTPIANVRIHAVTHMTVDLATGEAKASIDRFFFTCS